MNNPEEARNRVRIQITKNTKGYGYEKTVEYEWSGADLSYADNRISYLLGMADDLARGDIKRCEARDDEDN